MMKLMLLRLAECVKDIAMAIQSFGAPKGQVIPIRVEVHSKHQRRQMRR
jgi:hypothetical protein